MTDSLGDIDEIEGVDPDLLVFDEEELRRLTTVEIAPPEPEPEPAPEIYLRGPADPEPVGPPAEPEWDVRPPREEPPAAPPRLPPREPIATGRVPPPPPPPPPPQIERGRSPSEVGRKPRGLSRRAAGRIAVTAVLMVLLAVVSLLASRGDLQRWTQSAADRLDEMLRDEVPADLADAGETPRAAPRSSPKRSGTATRLPDPLDAKRRPPVIDDGGRDGEIAVDALPTIDFATGDPDEPDDEDGVEFDLLPTGPIEVEIEGHGTFVLQPGEVLIELKNGNFLQGRLLKVTDRILRLILEGGHVDIALERLKRDDDELERFRTLRHLPVRTILLRSGERVQGRILEVTETHVDMLFPTARVVFQRGEVEKIEK